jgi:hypothetical protein
MGFPPILQAEKFSPIKKYKQSKLPLVRYEFGFRHWLSFFGGSKNCINLVYFAI